MFTLTSEAKSGVIPSLNTKNQKHTWDYSKAVCNTTLQQEILHTLK